MAVYVSTWLTRIPPGTGSPLYYSHTQPSMSSNPYARRKQANQVAYNFGQCVSIKLFAMCYSAISVIQLLIFMFHFSMICQYILFYFPIHSHNEFLLLVQTGRLASCPSPSTSSSIANCHQTWNMAGMTFYRSITYSR